MTDVLNPGLAASAAVAAQPPADPAAASRPWEGTAASVAALAGLTLLAAAVLGHGFTGFDITYALNWGRELTRLDAPSYGTPFSPTPHPLATAVGALVAPLGVDGARIAVWLLTCAAFGAAVWLVFLLAAHLAGAAAGIVAAALTATSFPLMLSTTKAFVDLWVLVAVLFATLLVARRPRCGAPALLALAVAGLHRPEAWVLAGAYWLWLVAGEDRAGRIRLGLIAASAPVVWIAADYAMTGNPLFSLHDTRADKFTRPALVDVGPGHLRQGGATSPGPPATAEVLFRSLRDVLRLPALAGGVLGLGLGLLVALRRTAPVAAPAVAIALAFAALGAAKLPLADRFLFPTAAILAAFYGFAALGWVRQRPGWRRTAWMVTGCALLVVAVASLPARAGSLDRVRELAQNARVVDGDLRDLLGDEAIRRRLQGCAAVFTPNYRPKPYVALYLDRPLDDVIDARSAAARHGAFVAPATGVATRGFLGISGGKRLHPVPPPLGFRPVARNRSWVVLARGC